MLKIEKRRIKKIRGNEIEMVFKEKINKLKKVIKIGRKIEEGMRMKNGMKGSEERKRDIEMIERVRIKDVERRIDEYNKRMQGGKRKSVMIDIEIEGDKKIMIEEEKKKEIDVKVKEKIMEIIRNMRDEI